MSSKITKKLIAYSSAYFMKPYRSVKIFPAILTRKRSFSAEEKEHLTRPGLRWYVYFDYLNPKTGEYERQTPVTEKINRNFPDFDDRLQAIKTLKKDVLAILRDGYDPYDTIATEKDYTIASALYFAVENKKSEVAPKTYERYKGTVRALDKWLKDNGYSNYSIKKASKKILSEFLRHISAKTSNRSRNNYRGDLSALFSALMQEDYVTENPAAKIKNLPTAEKRDPTWSDKQIELVDTYLEKHDKVLLMFIHFVSYLFWRNKENCRLKVKDINLDQRLITTTTKTKGTKTKRIPDILIEDLREYLKGADPEDLLFTPEGTGKWETKLDGRRAYFTRKFAKVKKEVGLPKEYTIYGRRHTAVTKVYANLRSKRPENEAMQELANITGHTSQAIKAYIHYVDANVPEDYSEYLK